MRGRLLLLAPLIGALLTATTAQADNPPPPPPPITTPQNGLSELIAVPSVGHSGDTIYISGSGLRPNTRIDILMVCPAGQIGEAYTNNNFRWIQQADGPLTDARGRFSGFELKAIPLHKLRQSGCVIYTEDPSLGTPLGPDIPATYFIYPHVRKLPACAVTICAGLSLSPQRVHSGQNETIRIGPNQQKGYTSFPGAKATVSVQFRNQKGTTTMTKSTVLNWEGMGSVTMRVPTGMTLPSTAHVNVSYHLGRYTGRAVEDLAVVK
jgi:hypothetical protein